MSAPGSMMGGRGGGAGSGGRGPGRGGAAPGGGRGQDARQAKTNVPLGAASFGAEIPDGSVGAEAFGGPDADDPLRGSLYFGNDPNGQARGSEAFGAPDEQVPLKGALLFGNDPGGNPTGSEAFGGVEEEVPLKGALLFGNDPQGHGTGSEAFGSPDARFGFRGSQAFGAPQLLPERLFKDTIGYDFGGILLSTDEASMAGIRKDPRNHTRERVLAYLERHLAMEKDRLRRGVGENAIPWGRLKRDKSLDAKLAYKLRDLYSRAPGSVLGIGQVSELLETTDRMHTFSLLCQWDLNPVTLQVLWRDKPVAFGASAYHKEHRFFIFKNPEGETLAYVDAVAPRRGEQRSRIRSPRGETVGVFELSRPGLTDELDAEKRRFLGVVLDKAGRPAISIEEERASEQSFRAKLTEPEGSAEVGLVEDTLKDGKIRTRIELDLAMPRTVAWGLAAVLADLSRLRRRGWPKVEVPEVAAPEPQVESIEQALGPRTPRRRV